MHYLDNAATTPLDPLVAEDLARSQRDSWGNPSSLHPVGVAAARELSEARELMLGMLAATSVVFTGGGTEATNLAMRGFCRGKKGRIVVGAADHPSVVATARDLETEGMSVSVYPVDDKCRPKLDAFRDALDEDVLFVSLLHGNNEVGTLLPLDGMVRMVREHAPRAHLHVDGVQSFCKVPLDVERLGVDSITLAAHKIHGPKGVGALALGHRHQPRPVMTGGGQENGLRCGTENVCGNRAFARAAELWISNMHETSGHVQSLRDRVQRGLVDAIDDVEVLGDPDARLPHILCLAIRRVRGEVVMHHLEENGIYVSTGSACASSSRAKANTGSHVLEAMQLPQELINGTLRISFGRLNTDADADAVLQAMPAVVEQLRALGV